MDRESILRVERTDVGQGTTLVPVGRDVDESPAADVSADHPEIVAELRALHAAWERELVRR